MAEDKKMFRKKRGKHAHLISLGQVTKVEFNTKTEEMEATVKIKNTGEELKRSWPLDLDDMASDRFELEALLGGPVPEEFDPNTLEKREAFFVVTPKRGTGGRPTMSIVSVLDKKAIEACGATFPKETNK